MSSRLQREHMNLIIIILYLSLHAWWYKALFATIAASIPHPSLSLSSWSVPGSYPSSLNLLKFAANEMYPLPESFRLDFEGDVRDSDLSSWQITHSFQLVWVVCVDVHGTGPSSPTSWILLVSSSRSMFTRNHHQDLQWPNVIVNTHMPPHT